MQEAGKLVRSLHDAGVSAGVIQTAKDLASDPQMVERGFFRFIRVMRAS